MLVPNGDAERPVEQVAHVGQNLHRQAAGAVKTGKVAGCAFQRAGGAVGQGSQGMAQQFAFFVHTGNYSESGNGRLKHSCARLTADRPQALFVVN